MPSIACTDLTFAWPDGTTVFDGLDLTLGPGRTGLIGRNGSGKSTLFGLLARTLRPTRGAVRADGRVGLLQQHLTLQTDRPVDDVLGIAAQRRALCAVEAGDVTAEHLETLDGAWDVDARARATLDRLGLAHVGLDRTVGDLSGGESVLLALAALLVDPLDVLLLDEPTNNLDGRHRARLLEAVDAFRGVLVVVSHDRVLLGHTDRNAEVRDGTVRVHGGDLAAYEQAVAAEEDAARAGCAPRRLTCAGDAATWPRRRHASSGTPAWAVAPRHGAAFRGSWPAHGNVRRRSRRAGFARCTPTAWTRPSAPSTRPSPRSVTTGRSTSCCPAPACRHVTACSSAPE